VALLLSMTISTHATAQNSRVNQAVLEQIAWLIEADVRSGRFEMVRSDLNQMLRTSFIDIYRIDLYDPQERLLLQAVRPTLPDASHKTQQLDLKLGAAEQPIGRLVAEFDTTAFNVAPQQVKLLALVMLGIPSLCMLLAAGLFARSLQRRLVRMLHAVEQIAQGNFNIRLTPRGADELARLGRGVVQMASDLDHKITALQESEARFNLAMRASRDSLWDWHIPSDKFHISSRMGELLQLPKDKIPTTLQNWFKFIHPDDIARVKTHFQNHLQRNQPFELEFRLARADGEFRWVRGRGEAVRDTTGQAYHVAGSVTDITDTQEAQLRLQDALKRLRTLIETLPDVVIFKDELGRWQILNPAASELFKLEEHQWLNKTDLDLARDHPALRRMLLACHQHDQACWAQGRRYDSLEIVPSLQVGAARTFEVTRTPLFNEGGRRRGLVIVSRDTTQRRHDEEALFTEKERAQVTLQAITDGVITTDPQGRVDYLNPSAEQLTGWMLPQAKGKPLALIFNVIDANSRALITNPLDAVINRGEALNLEETIILLHSQGDEAHITLNAAPIRDRSGNPSGAVIVFHDSSEQHELMSKLAHQASHDALTQLHNRTFFEQHLQQMLNLPTEQRTLNNFLCYLDLDQFKIINDTCGHEAGDELLRRLSAVLMSKLRKQDILARIGGDEFALLLENCPQVRVLEITENLRRAVAEFRFPWQEKIFSLTLSIGVLPIPPDAVVMAELLSAADDACYAAKEQGRDRVHLTQVDDTEFVRRRGEKRWATRLQRALEEDRFILYAQPIVPHDPHAAEPAHFEVLIRMRDEQGAVILPGLFLPAAERYGLMTQIDRWVITHVLRTLGALLRSGAIKRHEIFLSVNLSGASLGEVALLNFIRENLWENGVSPKMICFEITETAAITNFNQAQTLIAELKKLGCYFSLDDFGSGFSSFSYLKSMPVDYLKIDGSFVRNITSSPQDAAMVEAMNQIGHVMGLKTIAEFVGDAETWAHIQNLGVDYGQGFHLGKPQPIDSLFPRPVT
jgi:diguanylate cyclase (GGDEF)-like protein/PAS domain S-box-containing protein